MKPLFKVGDTVRIKPRKGCSDDYRFAYSDSMTNYAGKLAQITFVTPTNSSYHYREIDDGHNYTLNIDEGCYNWASSMLEPMMITPDISNPNTSNPSVTSESTERINIKLKPVEKIKFNFKN